MIYPTTRHYQRYEYIIGMGYVTGKAVADIGCGYGYGTSMLATHAKVAYGFDPMLHPYIDKLILTAVIPNGPSTEPPHYLAEDYMEYGITDGEVAVLVEVIEHVKEPNKILEKIANEFEYLFITTPLAERTAPTRNPLHVQEFSKEDFDALVSKEFEIIDKVYQDGEMNITKDATPRGDSWNPEHIVQMAWCKSKRKDKK